MTAVLFTRTGHAYTVRFPYSPNIVAAIKDTVPGDVRSWHPATKCWTVDGWAEVLAARLHQLGYTVAGLDPPFRHSDEPCRGVGGIR